MSKQKDKSWFLWRGIATLILIGLLVGGGFAIHRAGWSQGYAAGQMADEGEDASPPSLYAPRPWGFAPRPFGAGALFRGLLLIFSLVLIGKLIRFVIWGPAWRFGMAGPWHGHWRAARWRRMHGPVPPWYGPWGQPPEEPGANAEAEA